MQSHKVSVNLGGWKMSMASAHFEANAVAQLRLKICEGRALTSNPHKELV